MVFNSRYVVFVYGYQHCIRSDFYELFAYLLLLPLVGCQLSHWWLNTCEMLKITCISYSQVSNFNIFHPWEYTKWRMNSLAWTKRLPGELCLQQHPVMQSLKKMCKKQAWLADASLCIPSWLPLLSLSSFPITVSPFPETKLLSDLLSRKLHLDYSIFILQQSVEFLSALMFWSL